MGIFKRIGLALRMARRVGAFKRAMKAGLSADEARAYSDKQYPPTVEDTVYEHEMMWREILKKKRSAKDGGGG